MFARVTCALVPADETSGTTCTVPLLVRVAYAVAYCGTWEEAVSTVPPAFLYAVTFASTPLSSQPACNHDRLPAPLATSLLVTMATPDWKPSQMLAAWLSTLLRLP